MYDSLQKALLDRWFKLLLLLAAGNIALSLIGFLPINATWITWARYVMFLFCAYCLLQLRCVHAAYRKAAIFKGLMVLCALANMMMASSLALAVSAFSLLATYLEYAAHAKAIRKADPALARKWYALFNIGLLLAAVSVLVSMAAAALLSVTGAGTGLFNLISYIVIAAELALQVFYLLYLNRTRSLLLEA